MQAKIGILKELLNNFEVRWSTLISIHSGWQNISNADKKHRVKVVNAIKQQLGGAHVSSIDEEVKRMVVQFYLELEKETKNLKESQKQEVANFYFINELMMNRSMRWSGMSSWLSFRTSSWSLPALSRTTPMVLPSAQSCCQLAMNSKR